MGFVRALATFLRALWSAGPTDDSAADAAAARHSFYRGCPPGWYAAEVETALATLGERVDQPAARAVWRAALASRWSQRPVWFHGDIAPGNLLLDSAGQLCAVIDFGTSGIGDPACDLVITWTLLSGEARESVPQRRRARRGDLGPGPRLDPVEVPDRARCSPHT